MTRRYGMSTGLKVFLWVVGILVVLVGVFCGLYFGVPEVHDWVVELFKGAETVEEGTQAAISVLSLK